jgi:flagellar biosynthesis/type III secretory pathway M-ring protein FliF/YscJ
MVLERHQHLSKIRQQQLKQLQDWVKKNPKQTAALVQQWLRLNKRG